MKKYIYICCLISVAFLSSCDSGDIYPEKEKQTGLSVSTSFRFLHTGAFSTSDYEIILGLYTNEGATTPVSSKVLSKPQENKLVNVTLDNVPENATYLRLALVRTGKETMYVFYESPIDPLSGSNIILPEEEINLLAYSRIQQQVFRQCVACHGSGDRVSGNLYLTADKSYENLVDAQSRKSTKKRVYPLFTEESFLMDVLTKENEIVGLNYDHHKGISSLKGDDITLLNEWIKDGAEKY